MKKKQQAPTTYTTDADGQRLAHVAMANTDQRATLYAEDLDRLLVAGWSQHWSWCKTNPRFRYVLAYARTPAGKQRSITIARLIAGAGKGQVVEYIDGDRSNLRRDNLRIVRGSGRTQTPADAVLPCHPCNLPDTWQGTIEAPQEAAGNAHAGASQRVPCTTPSGTPREPQEVRNAHQRDPMLPPVAHVPRVIDRAALSARVRQQMTQRSQQQDQQDQQDQQ
ncbi:hypothetical protein [Rhodanobacter sp. PCA2]|uniref:hypothetical protein n=1 Tax=Rhodanobacter sp. PCA2 TaxID=2006117 RepID=UPI0015E665EE|nr:hypothetical protein [Rhodanobacter sp. PCA2]MBA2077048.1 hypothetical protein [Rhodanobacter sp. PCA2]